MNHANKSYVRKNYHCDINFFHLLKTRYKMSNTAAVPTNKSDNDKKAELKRGLTVPLVLIVIAVLMVLVAAIFVSITYYQASKGKALVSKSLGSSVNTVLLIALIAVWIAFIFGLILLIVTYFTYDKMDSSNYEDAKKYSNWVWISVLISAVLILVVGLICLYLTFKFKAFNNVLFTNILVATVTSIGGFIFILLGALAYGKTSGKFNQWIEDRYGKRGKNQSENPPQTQPEATGNTQ